jgi:hypothetical protein
MSKRKPARKAPAKPTAKPPKVTTKGPPGSTVKSHRYEQQPIKFEQISQS